MFRRWADGAVTGTGSWDSSKSGLGIFINSHFDSGNIEVRPREHAAPGGGALWTGGAAARAAAAAMLLSHYDLCTRPVCLVCAGCGYFGLVQHQAQVRRLGVGGTRWWRASPWGAGRETQGRVRRPQDTRGPVHGEGEAVPLHVSPLCATRHCRPTAKAVCISAQRRRPHNDRTTAPPLVVPPTSARATRALGCVGALQCAPPTARLHVMSAGR